jgi:hypothetical protein
VISPRVLKLFAAFSSLRWRPNSKEKFLAMNRRAIRSAVWRRCHPIHCSLFKIRIVGFVAGAFALG